MDLVRQYIIQCVQSAANNLRLSSEKIEVVALLREHLNSACDIEKEIQHLKKITEFSKFAIRLGEVYNYIAKDKVDFLKISDKFKEHSSLMVREMNYLLDVVTPIMFREKLAPEPPVIEVAIKKDESLIITDNSDLEESNESENEVMIDSDSEIITDSQNTVVNNDIPPVEAEEIKQDRYDNYESEILDPIKKLDSLLENIARQEIKIEEIDIFIDIIRNNHELTRKLGFEVLSNMHRIFLTALELLRERKLLPVIPVIEGMRACLIVIVALVRGKDVDITSYLNRAELFGKQIESK